MCGRYAVYTGFSNPNYNASPGQFLPVLVNRDYKNKMELMRWGLVPSWAQDDKRAMINARAETLLEKPTFKSLVKRNRCLVPANGFFEWGLRNNQKWPFYFKLKNYELFAFAGIYSTWTSSDGSEINTYTIITTEPNELAAKVHNRMPSIIHPKDESSWLSTKLSPDQIPNFLKPFPENEMDFYPVSLNLNTPGINTSDLIKPI